jgi:RIO-like serine/threonine protein kinase
MLSDFLNEVSTYGDLEVLQRKSVPHLLFHGYLESVLYCIGSTLCGKTPTLLNNLQKKKLLDTLANVHKAGILHNDINATNTLVDDEGNPYLIDFGNAITTDSHDAQVAEQHQLSNCTMSKYMLAFEYFTFAVVEWG